MEDIATDLLAKMLHPASNAIHQVWILRGTVTNISNGTLSGNIEGDMVGICSIEVVTTLSSPVQIVATLWKLDQLSNDLSQLGRCKRPAPDLSLPQTLSPVLCKLTRQSCGPRPRALQVFFVNENGLAMSARG